MIWDPGFPPQLDFPRRLVFPQAFKRRLTQAAVERPVRELHLGDELRADPEYAGSDLLVRAGHERASFLFEDLQPPRQVDERLLVEAGPHAAGVGETAPGVIVA